MSLLRERQPFKNSPLAPRPTAGADTRGIKVKDRVFTASEIDRLHHRKTRIRLNALRNSRSGLSLGRRDNPSRQADS